MAVKIAIDVVNLGRQYVSVTGSALREGDLGPTNYVAFDGLKVGIADDSAYFRRLLRTMLSGCGIRQIEETTSAAGAHDLVIQHQPDILLLDLQFADGSGLAVLDRIRCDPDDAIATAAVIVVSAHADRRHVVKAARSGANDFIVKPLSARLLYERLKRITTNQQLFVRRQGRALPLPLTGGPQIRPGSGTRTKVVLAPRGNPGDRGVALI